MKRTPMLMHVQIQGEGSRFCLWLPLLLLFLLALLILIILSPLMLVAILILWLRGWGKWALPVLRNAFEIFFALHGLRVDIQGRNQCIYISVV